MAASSFGGVEGGHGGEGQHDEVVELVGGCAHGLEACAGVGAGVVLEVDVEDSAGPVGGVAEGLAAGGDGDGEFEHE
jgi:hypothetical protein